jgi:S-adenosylmethionine/arginine decarboxylase-like enzyme
MPDAPTQAYGFELVLDMHGCDSARFNRDSIDRFFTELCAVINMQRCVVHFWDDVGVPKEEQQTLPHTKGTSAVCFILTSSIVIHTLDLLEAVYLNIFSCKPFDPEAATAFARNWFLAQDANSSFLTRI